MDRLQELRKQIDFLDEKIVELFEKRMEIVLSIAKYKEENNLPVLNNLREEEVIEKNIERLNNRELETYLRDFLLTLMNLSKDYQNEKINKDKNNL